MFALSRKELINANAISFMYILLLLLIIPGAYGWNCDTHQYICNAAGFYGYDCCAADDNKVQKEYDYISERYHHCARNDDECKAMVSAGKYINGSKQEKEIALHLIADSLTPVHWWTTYYNQCHGPLEEMMDEKVRSGEDFVIEYECELKNGSIFKITMEKEYLDYVAEYTRNYTLGLPVNRSSYYLSTKDCTGKECGYIIPYKQELLVLFLIVTLILIVKYGSKSSRKLFRLRF